MAEKHDLLRSTMLISALTMLSRVLGLVRDVVFAACFGGGAIADAFLFAWRVPNLFRRLFGEGALTAAFVPIFTEYIELRDRKEAWRLGWVVATAVGAVLLACLLLGEAVVLILPHVAHLNDRWRLPLVLTAVMLPYMLFICLTATASAMLNSLRHFAAPALSPVVLNLIWIIAVLVVAPLVTQDQTGRAFVVAAGVLVAGVFQLLLQVAVLLKLGMPWSPVLDLKHPGLRQTASHMAPVVIGLTIFQINVLLDSVIAVGLSSPEGRETFSLMGATIAYPMRVGANTALYYGDRVMQLPLGVFGVALATAIFPTLSSCAARKDWTSYSETLLDGLGAVLFIGIPASAAIALLAGPTTDLLFLRGEFTAVMSARTAAVLAAYAAGIWAYSAQQVLTRAFYSMQDTITPVKIGVASVALNLTLNLTLVWFAAEAGLAIATAISASVSVVVLYVILLRRIGRPRQSRLARTLLKTLAATALMAAACYFALHTPCLSPQGSTLGARALRVAIPSGAGAAAFLLAGAALRLPEMEQIYGPVRRLLRRR